MLAPVRPLEPSPAAPPCLRQSSRRGGSAPSEPYALFRHRGPFPPPPRCSHFRPFRRDLQRRTRLALEALELAHCHDCGSKREDPCELLRGGLTAAPPCARLHAPLSLLERASRAHAPTYRHCADLERRQGERRDGTRRRVQSRTRRSTALRRSHLSPLDMHSCERRDSQRAGEQKISRTADYVTCEREKEVRPMWGSNPRPPD